MKEIAPPPRAVVWVALAVLVAGVAMSFAGAWRTGVAWDETYHVMRMDNYERTGWFSLDRDFAGKGPTAENRTTYVYGPVTMIGLRAWSDLLGVDNGNGISTTPHAYAVRHLGVAVLGLAGLLAAAAIAGLVLRSRRWAVVCGAVLGALPLWTGHTMFNIKDIPVATGVTLVTLSLVWMTRPGPTRWFVRLARVVILAAGITLALGTRPGIWTAVLAGILSYAFLVVLARLIARDVDRPPLSGLLEVAVGGLAAAGLLVAAYPNAFRTPLTLLRRSADSSRRFRAGDGSDHTYLFEHVATSVPVVLILLWLTGIAVAAFWLFRGRSSPVAAVGVTVVGVQALTLPLVAIVLGSDLYNGLRQMIFVAPASAVLATLGLAHLLGAGLPRLLRGGVLVLALGFGLVLPVLDQATLFPYGYAYGNVVADAVGADTDGDYWRTSVKELLDEIPDDGQVVCSPARLADGSVTRNAAEGTTDCRISDIGPLMPFWIERDRPVDHLIPDQEFYAVITGTDEVPTNCTLLHRVTRWRHGRTVEMSQVDRCSRDAPLLPPTGMGVGRDPSTAWLFAVRGFEAGVIRNGFASHGEEATVAFRLPASCVADCTIAVAADLPADVVVRVDGRQLPTTRVGERRVLVTVPGSVASAHPHGLWLDFSRTGSGALGMTFRGLTLLPGP